MYYVAKVTLTETVDTNNGGTKETKSRYQYLVEAVSVTDAETKMVADMQGTVSEWEVTGVAKSQIVDVIG